MNQDLRIFLVVMGVIVVCCVMAMHSKLEWLLNIVMRSILGAVSIYFVNMGLTACGISSGVGLNAFSVLTIGILGFPGFLAIYGIGFFGLL